MSWQDASTRPDLVSKQVRIAKALEDFRRQILIPPKEISLEMREILLCIHRYLFDSDLNVTTVRRRCGLRNNNISTRFRCTFGQGLRDYIETGRVEAAKRLLSDWDLEVYLIAMAVGYEYQETFCRAFQRQTGHTPSGWREVEAGGEPPRRPRARNARIGQCRGETLS